MQVQKWANKWDNIKMKRLQQLFQNSLTVRLEAPATDGIELGGGDFTPAESTQGTGIFLDKAQMRAKAEAQQANEEETGSLEGVAPEAPEAPVTDVPIGAESLGADETNTPDVPPVGGTGYLYNGVAVEVENKPEMVELFAEKGIDIDKVNKELYSAEGLTEGTKAVLDDKFGKVAVDMYLEGWSTKNDALVANAGAEAEAESAKVTQILTDIAGDKHAEVFTWANDNLSAEEYKEYADIINGDNHIAMKFAFKELHQRSGVGATLQAPSVKLSPRATALSPDTTAPVTEPSGLSHAQYQALFKPSEGGGESPYWADPAKYDALREVGRSQGI